MSNNLPSLTDLQLDVQQALKDDALNLLLNQPPPQKWIKKHPTIGHNYLPIDKVEYLMTKIFKQWRVEVVSIMNMFNSVAVTVRLHYLNPTTNEWSFHDGVGAHNLQLDSGASPSDLSKIKANAVMMSLPIAKSNAIKDAADHLGSLFGRDLSRKDTIQFEGFTPPPAPQPPVSTSTTTTIDNNLEF